MAKGSRYRLPQHRRIEGKTDYHARKALVLSGKPRLVARITLKNVIAQIIIAKPQGDEVLVSAHSKELKDYAWKAPMGNLPTAYLTGLLCGLKAKAKGVAEAIFDIGLHSPSKGGRIFAVLKGALDAGISVPHSKEKLPEEKRIEGEHIAKYAETFASSAEEYQSKFAKYLEQKLSPETLPKHFTEVRTEILAAFKSGGKKK
ncbi:50S ribosomal protein L18 [Candidatus Bathyarchaeota archaeon]|nr:50S ribosomal protein L18 [Candidatus Bathyarchaeota archaeon]